MAQFFLQLGHLEYYGFLFSTFDKYNWFLKLVLKLVGCFLVIERSKRKHGVKGPKEKKMDVTHRKIMPLAAGQKSTDS